MADLRQAVLLQMDDSRRFYSSHLIQHAGSNCLWTSRLTSNTCMQQPAVLRQAKSAPRLLVRPESERAAAPGVLLHAQTPPCMGNPVARMLNLGQDLGSKQGRDGVTGGCVGARNATGHTRSDVADGWLGAPGPLNLAASPDISQHAGRTAVPAGLGLGQPASTPDAPMQREDCWADNASLPCSSARVVDMASSGKRALQTLSSRRGIGRERALLHSGVQDGFTSPERVPMTPRSHQTPAMGRPESGAAHSSSNGMMNTSSGGALATNISSPASEPDWPLPLVWTTPTASYQDSTLIMNFNSPILPVLLRPAIQVQLQAFQRWTALVPAHGYVYRYLIKQMSPVLALKPALPWLIPAMHHHDALCSVFQHVCGS